MLVQSSFRRLRPWLLLLVGPLLTRHVSSHESCCLKAANAFEKQGPVEMVPDMTAHKPSHWDDEEDGPWERPMIPKPVPGPLETFRDELLGSLDEAAPWLLLGLFCTGLMKIVAPSEDSIRKYLSGQGRHVVVKGAVLGLLSPLCSCGALPIAVGLAGVGAGAPAIVAFIIAAQSAGIDSMIFTIGVLGPTCAAARLAAAGALAILAGLSLTTLTSSQSSRETKGESQLQPVRKSLISRVGTSIREAVTGDFDEVAPSLMLGFVLTSALSTVLSTQQLAQAASLGGVLGRAAVLFVALPLQFCEHASVPLAAALPKAGGSGGLAFALLITMPAVNVASAGVIAKVAGAFGALKVLLAIWLSGIAGSYVADTFGMEVVRVGHAEDALPQWYVHASKWVMGTVALFAICRAVVHRTSSRDHSAHSHCCDNKKSR